MMGPMPQGQAPAEGQQEPGGASKLVADTHTNLVKLQEMVASKFPEEAEALAQVVQAYQAVVESLGSPAGGKPPEKSAPGMVPPEAGGANVKPVL